MLGHTASLTKHSETNYAQRPAHSSHVPHADQATVFPARGGDNARLPVNAMFCNIGQCVQTAIDKINVICFPIEENHIRIIVRTSYARALIGWFKDACLEFI